MKLTNKHYQIFFITLSVLSGSFYLYGVFSQEIASSVFLYFTVFGLVFVYLFSQHYKQRNSLDKLILRKGQQLQISALNFLPWPKSNIELIELDSISIVTIDDNMLSIIINGNGKGYDFALSATQQEIDTYLKGLLTASELNKIIIQHA